MMGKSFNIIPTAAVKQMVQFHALLVEMSYSGKQLNKRLMGLYTLLGYLPKFQKLHIYALSIPEGRN